MRCSKACEMEMSWRRPNPVCPVAYFTWHQSSQRDCFGGPDIATKLYPHQKKALTFLLEREKEIAGPDGKNSSLWQLRASHHTHAKSWINLVTSKEVGTEPEECKGALLADDVRLIKHNYVCCLIFF